MAKTTGIAWTDSTFNPWIGCTKVGPGCDHCYAEVRDNRKQWDGGKTHWGAGKPRYRTSASNWAQPLAWNAKQTSMLAGDPDTPPHRVFCASLADVFDNEVPEQWRTDLWALIKATPHLTWQIVTKRIGNAAKMLPADWGDGYPNVWLIATICDESELHRDIHKFMATPAIVHGVSYEPALGPIDWRPWLKPCGPGIQSPDPHGRDRALDWIIVGGESSQGGAQARPFDIGWARSTVAQCKANGVPVFVKQLGSWPRSKRAEENKDGCYSVALGPGEQLFDLMYDDRAGADPEEWPDDLRIRQFPEDRT